MKNLRGDVIPINLRKVYQKELLLQSYVIEKIGANFEYTTGMSLNL